MITWSVSCVLACFAGVALANADQWSPPRWQYYKKHLPPDSRVKKWELLVRETKERGHRGYYHPDFRDQIQTLETIAFNNGEFLSQRGPVRCYWHKFDHVIGASQGETTAFVLIEYHQDGWYHGHPVTWQELKKKGAINEDPEPQ